MLTSCCNPSLSRETCSPNALPITPAARWSTCETTSLHARMEDRGLYLRSPRSVLESTNRIAAARARELFHRTYGRRGYETVLLCLFAIGYLHRWKQPQGGRQKEAALPHRQLDLTSRSHPETPIAKSPSVPEQFMCLSFLRSFPKTEITPSRSRIKLACALDPAQAIFAFIGDFKASQV